MPPLLEIRLFGTVELRAEGVPLPPLPSARAQSLLGYLLVHRGAAVPRERLAASLWPESTEAQARTNLRHVLHTLRRGLPDADDHLEVTASTLRWRGTAPFWLDLAAFELLLAAGPPDRMAALTDAVALVAGELVEGADDAWLTEPRQRIRRQLTDALSELAGLCEAAGRGAEAVGYAERLLRLDPLAESTYRLLMRLHDAHGDRARALRTYHVCSTTLERELGVEPSPTTRAAYAALLPPVSVPTPAPSTGGRPPLVGRDVERARLGATWRSVSGGRAQLSLVTGEAGVGKTRLAEEFRAWCARQGASTADARCYAADGPLPYGAVVAWLRTDAIRPRLAGLDQVRLTELARLLPELLREVNDLPPPEVRPEDEQRSRVFDAVVAALDLIPAPLVLLVDDLQYADRESCRLIHYLLRVRPEARLLVLATARFEEAAGEPVRDLLAALGMRGRLARIELEPLKPSETAALVGRLTGAPLSATDARRLHDQTGGNPLLVVETVRAGWRSGSPNTPLSPLVQAVLEARLAPLSRTARDLVSAGAVIGRAFDIELLAAVAWGTDDATDRAGGVSRSAANEDALVSGLDELWRHGIVRERDDRATAGSYDFTHGTLRDVAAARLSPVRRTLLHRRVARALASRAGAHGTGAAEVAAHFALAGDSPRAAEWYRRAAEAAQLLHAHSAAVGLIQRALQLLAGQPGSTAQDAQELELQTALLAPLVSEQGYASPAVSAVQQRAQTLTGSLGAEPSPPLLRSLAMTALTRNDFAAAATYGRQLLAAAEADVTGVLAVEADTLLGFAAFWLADFPTARDHLERAVARYRPDQARHHLIHYGQDPQAVALARLGNTRWFLGDPDGALAARAAALAWADELGHPFSRSAVLLFGALLALDMGDEANLRAYVVALADASVEAPPLRLSAAALRGHLRVLDGAYAEGIGMIRRAIEEGRAGAGAPGMDAILSRILLAACAAHGDAAAALDAADAVLAAGPAGSVWAAEARRVRTAFLALRP